MLKRFVIPTILLFATSAYAARTEFGKFDAWDVYRLDFKNQANPNLDKLCGVRGFFDGGYKVVFSIYVDGSAKLFIKNNSPSWILQPGEGRLTQVAIFSGQTIIQSYLLQALNDTNIAAKQVGYNIAVEFVKSILSGTSLVLYGTPNGDIRFNINNASLAKAISVQINSCLASFTSGNVTSLNERSRNGEPISLNERSTEPKVKARSASWYVLSDNFSACKNLEEVTPEDLINVIKSEGGKPIIKNIKDETDKLIKIFVAFTDKSGNKKVILMYSTEEACKSELTKIKNAKAF